MNSQQTDRAGSISNLTALDNVCQQFAADWAAGKKPRIEDFVVHNELERETLLWQLLQVEWELLESEDNPLSEDDYFERFSDDKEIVRSALKAYAGDVDETVEWRNADGDTETRKIAVRGLPPMSGSLAHYEILKLLGQGAFGAVYLARDSKLDRLVALKILREDRREGAPELETLMSEARMAAQLTHPNVISVYEAGSYDSIYYIATDYVRGQTLRAAVGAYSHRQVAELVGKLAVAMHHAHNKGIIHRDIKPANILMDEAGEPHIADFGLALWDSTKSAEAGPGRMGTPAYMSPEQAKGESHLADARSDLWSLGVVLFELLTQRRPFQGSAVDVMKAVCTEDAPSPRELDASISPDLAAICSKCLARDADERYPSCQHLADELQRWMEDKPVAARPLSMVARVGRWCRRQPVVSGMIATVVALAVFATVTTIQRLQAELRTSELREENARKESRNSLYQDAITAGQSGQWSVAIEKAQKAIEAGHEDEARMRLVKLRALTSEFRPTEYREELKRLGQSTAVGERERVEILLLQADIASFDGEEKRARSLTDQAIAIGLTDAQTSFVAGLESKNGKEAIEHFQQTVDLDPYMLEAWAYLCIELVFSGQRDRAREACTLAHGRFPKHPAFVTLLTFMDACDGDQAAVQNRLKWFKKNAGDDYVSAIRLAIELISHIKVSLDLGRQPNPFQAIGTAAAIMQMRGGSFLNNDMNIRLPERLKEGFLGMVMAIPGYLTKIDKKSLETAMGKVAHVHPEGVFLYFHGRVLEESGKTEEAKAEYARAAAAPSLFPETQRTSLFFLARRLAAEAIKKGDADSWNRALEVAKRRYDLGHLSVPEAHQLADIGINAKDYAFAESAAEEVLKLSPQHLKALHIKLLTTYKRNDFKEAIAVADRILADHPDDMHAILIKARAEHRIEALEEVAKKERAKASDPAAP